MASIDSIVAALGGAVDALRRAAAHVRAALDGAEGLRTLGESVGVRDVVERADMIVEATERLAVMIATGIELVEDAIARVEAIRGGGQVPGPGGGPGAVDSDRLAGPAAVGGTIGQAADVLPVRPDNQGPTSGQLFDEHSSQVGSGVIRSFRDDTLTEDLQLPRRALLSEAMSSHVEAKVAAMMRRGQAPHASVLVINNELGPCGWLMRQRGQRRFGATCDELLADVLPTGSVLTVRWRDADGVERSEVYRGTGRRIEG